VTTLLNALPVETGGRDCFVGAARLDPGTSLADSPLLPGSVLSVGGPGPDYQPVRGQAAGTLHVIAGPDEGFGIALRPGRYSVGRTSESDVYLHDTDVSRRHALVEVATNGAARVTDLGSRNGTFMNGVQVTEPTELDGGDVVRIGRDQFRWTSSGTRKLRISQTPDGQLEFDRAFAEKPTVPHGAVNLPPSKDPPAKNLAMMALTGFVGMAAGVVMAVMGHQLTYLVFSLSGVLMPFAQHAIEQHQGKSQLAELADSRKSAQDQAAALAEKGTRALRRRAPGPAEIIQMATGARADLWPRDARSEGGLLLRVGVADQRPSFDVRGEPWEGFEAPVLRGVPVTLDLRETGVLGVIGAGEPPRGLLRWLLTQLGTLCSPDDLRLVVLISDHAEPGVWSRWLPHLNPGTLEPMPCWIGNTGDTRAARIEELTKLITARRGSRSESSQPPGPDVVVVLDGALALRNLPGIRDILLDGPAVGVYSVCLDTQGMNECRSVCEVSDDSVAITPAPDGLLGPVTPEFMDASMAEEAARALAPMRDRVAADAQTTIPYPVRLLDVMHIGEPMPDDVLALWDSKKAGPNVRVALGADASGPAYVDLAGQGPHTMLGGATGAGKSILLQTLVTALLLANRPDELNLVLVDFKGGSAFLPFERCPHVTALIRSTGETAADTFDAADAARVLASVRAEVSRRESILARYGGEIDAYWRTRASDPCIEPLPRLVMIFDEFARVLDISPDFLKELVNVAGKGRSLGMHLVLATQSLQGKLNEELKNNISLRISLRQNEPADSTEVLGAPDAAAIPGTLRGRGMYLWTGDPSRTPHPFQSGYLGNPPPKAGQEQTSVRTLGWADLGEPRPVAAASGGGATDQDLTVAAVEEASKRLDLPAPFRALLPGLPARVPLERLSEYQTAEPPEDAVPFGLMDKPDLQAQPAFYLDLTAADHLMVAGGPQSGRTTFARALITGLASRFRPDQVHLYVVEHQPAGLADYSGLPHCGGVFSPKEPDRIRRLVGWLDAETQRRLATRFDADKKDDPHIVVIVDGWEQFESRANPDLAEVSLGPTLRGVIETGAPVGVHIVPIGGQDLLSGKVPALCNHRLLLPFPNEDTRRTQLRSGMTSPPLMPGRAIDAATGRHVQICEPDETAAGLMARTAAAHGSATADPARLPRPFPSLPTHISVEDVALPEPISSPSWIPLGVGGDSVATVGIDMFDIGPHLMFIAGPPGSGRTTAIATLAKLLAWNGISVLAVAPPQSPLRTMVSGEDDIKVVTGLTVEDSALREAAESFGEARYAVLFDDAERITVRASKEGFSEAPTLLEEISQPAAFGNRALIIAADPGPIVSGQRRSLAKVTSEIMLTGTRLLLTPAKRPDAKALNITLEPDQYFTRPPGRGYLASVGAPTLIQLATAAH
jgi:S-DNA-T family DNA segregation ATPase FtsK/SpoIIIE